MHTSHPIVEVENLPDDEQPLVSLLDDKTIKSLKKSDFDTEKGKNFFKKVCVFVIKARCMLLSDLIVPDNFLTYMLPILLHWVCF